MAITAAAHSKIVTDGLNARAKADRDEMNKLSAEGVPDREVMRRVLFPWKTPKEFGVMCAEYDRAFQGGKR